MSADAHSVDHERVTWRQLHAGDIIHCPHDNRLEKITYIRHNNGLYTTRTTRHDHFKGGSDGVTRIVQS